MPELRELLHAAEIPTEMKASARRLTAHLGEHRVVVDDGWHAVATACGLVNEAANAAVPTVLPGQTLLVVGSVSARLPKEQGELFGFVALGAVRRKMWQRERTRFEEPTMTLWRAGWSPINVDRFEVATVDATVELVVGIARPTPGAAG